MRQISHDIIIWQFTASQYEMMMLHLRHLSFLVQNPSHVLFFFFFLHFVLFLHNFIHSLLACQVTTGRIEKDIIWGVRWWWCFNVSNKESKDRQVINCCSLSILRTTDVMAAAGVDSVFSRQDLTCVINSRDNCQLQREKYFLCKTV